MHHYSYDTPKGDVYGFFALAFIAGAIGLARKSPNYYRDFLWEVTLSCSYIAAIYLWPAFICFRAAFDHDIKITEWTIWKRSFVAQGAIDGFMTFLLGGLFFVKIIGLDKSIQHWSSDDDLRRKYVNGITGEKAEQGGENVVQVVIWYKDHCPILHPVVQVYFTLRYVVTPCFYVPGMTITNLVFLAVFYRPGVHFTEILFIVTFWIALALFWFGLSKIGGLSWAARTAFSVWYSVQLCWCVADSNLLADLQLGFLAIFLSSIFDLLTSNERKTFHTIRWDRFQWFCWAHRKDTQDQCGSKGGTCLWCKKSPDEQKAEKD
ncbi:hypothetical protein LTR47_011426 [Exophiala xenobiotica]|nr:hypothetical protein LTR41_011479 [Exophiala xenobiotica]KAK5215155.1 hypothetical protein LTR72_011768 [Exophiala xenobiotica]KAK5219782.1 hypothetical protein LTR47_011426 [Exophiala xenobiotica]KAK5243241.1 hypothetical protein LTS06_010952 [Exophiala xenobiotica]KAK5260802.1 hypothetical protein LTR40_003468 [Exophiala xenobiotica]